MDARGTSVMIRILTFLPLAALLASPIAEARPVRATAKPQISAAIKARQSVMNDFGARMSRLDALMGTPSVSSPRSHSAEAGR
ncbi:hypothetical protein [Methylobacterium sp. NEAU K]|uniref:hypothetical protein n=1 Tax=Methylobacterium sp. NEAU K TaxID=3064946 RepID=UPI0027365696|nr:hypothetical protein [Methylobacterium sp. NEAU K]MDP4004727.1 hypothetical protein [Methylobacterium sp. NEAU K]